MNVTLLGTGSPAPVPERAGTAITISSGGERLLFDCGPGTVHRLVENGINPASIDRLFFTHHHIDHNADFYYFIITKCTRSDTPIAIHGPNPWTQTLLDSLYAVYDEDIEYRERVVDSTRSLRDLNVSSVSDHETVETDRFRISAREVQHSIETYAYRITEKSSDRSLVFSGDTAKIDHLIEFSTGADVLIQDSCLVSSTNSPRDGTGEFVWETYTDEIPDTLYNGLKDVHCDPTEAGEIATQAGVQQLILTHLLPYRDEGAMADLAASTFDGEIAVARDGMQFSV